MQFPGKIVATTAFGQLWLRRAVAAILIFVAAVYIIDMMADRWHDLRLSAFIIGTSHWIVLCVGTIGTTILSAMYHVLLLRGIEAHNISGIRVARAYALGQLVRYIPGKIVGVAFQVGLLSGSVRAGSIVLALLVQTVHDYAWALAFCGALTWALLVKSSLPLLTFIPLVFLLQTLHRNRWIEQIIASLPFLHSHIPAIPVLGPKHTLASTLTLFTTWVPMLMAMTFTFSPLLGTQNALLAGLLYPIAAVTSLAIIVVPSGLIVREALFIWLGGHAGLPADTLLFVALATRISMTIAEVITALMIVLLEAGQRVHHTDAAS